MKRFHVHVTVKDIGESVRFYSKVFGVEPTVLEHDYAKWMVDDPRINFAISAHGGRSTGVNHLGLQVDSDEELKGMRAQLAAADDGLTEESGVNCCYAKSDKYWVTDPQGIAWETWHNLGSVARYGEEQQRVDASSRSSGCCPPEIAEPVGASSVKRRSTCCA